MLFFNIIVFENFKDQINSLTDMNRQLEYENQQFKERNLEQRQRLEHFHVLFQESNQKTDQSLSQMRTEREEALQAEQELKRRMQLALDTQQQENTLAIETWKQKLEDMKSKEIYLSQELNTINTQLQQEKNKNELLEKKFNVLEKDSGLLKEYWATEKLALNGQISESEIRLEMARKQFMSEKQKMEEKFKREKEELCSQVRELEAKIEEVIKDKSQISYKYGQLLESGREMEGDWVTKEQGFKKKVDEMREKLEGVQERCGQLEKEIEGVQKAHVRETEEWKKFQADLQTAVVVANDFMIGKSSFIFVVVKQQDNTSGVGHRLDDKLGYL